jgi:Trp operon repressor
VKEDIAKLKEFEFSKLYEARRDDSNILNYIDKDMKNDMIVIIGKLFKDMSIESVLKKYFDIVRKILSLLIQIKSLNLHLSLTELLKVIDEEAMMNNRYYIINFLIPTLLQQYIIHAKYLVDSSSHKKEFEDSFSPDVRDMLTFYNFQTEQLETLLDAVYVDKIINREDQNTYMNSFFYGSLL